MYELIVKPFGFYETNCYIIKTQDNAIVIDPGDGAFEYLKNNFKNVAAVLNTHAHHDHIWDNRKVVEYYGADLYVHIDDLFLLSNLQGYDFLPSKDLAKTYVDKEKINILGFDFTFHHFPGHTPGCSVIEFDNLYFSGDFLFKRSIGRWDFAYSNPNDMINSLNKAQNLKDDYILLPGHGESSVVFEEKPHFNSWVAYIEKCL